MADCSRCDDYRWVCENHPERPWEGPRACAWAVPERLARPVMHPKGLCPKCRTISSKIGQSHEAGSSANRLAAMAMMPTTSCDVRLAVAGSIAGISAVCSTMKDRCHIRTVLN